MADIIQIQDANGKTIPVDISKICDISGDCGETSTSVNDNLQNRVARVHDVVYVNQNGEVIDNMKLVQDIQSGKTAVAAIDVELEATHSGKNHNYCIYYEDSMEKDAETFVNPFKKPMLKNHDSYSEPLGRITQSWHAPSALTDERSAIHLKVRVTDQDAILKFLDGRYGTVSIGGRMGTVTCNVCGKTILKDGKFKFCGHWRGESYKDQMCYWGARDITYNEVSTVNTPADDFAQVMKVTVVTDSENKKDNQEENKMGGTNTDGKKNETLKQISDMIDSLLNPKTTDSANTQVDDSQTQAQANDGAGEQPKDEPQAQDSNKELETAKQELADAQAKITELENQLKDAQAELAKVKEDLIASETDAAQFKEKCVTLATANKEMLADSIIEKEVAAGKTQKDAVETRKEELVAMSMKDLNKMKEEQVAKDETIPRTPASVPNPTLANPVKDSNGSADANKKTTDDNKAKKTVDDFAKDIVSKLVK